jgi:hypothetical protein
MARDAWAVEGGCLERAFVPRLNSCAESWDLLRVEECVYNTMAFSWMSCC